MKKLINMMLLLIVLISLISFSVNAATTDYQRTSVARFDFGRVGDGLRGGLNRIEDFFSGGWQNYEKTVVFVIFFFLFFSAYLIGMKKAMGGELTRAHTTFAFTAAFLSSFIIVITLRFDWVNLEYVAWFLIAVLILFMIYSLLVKLGLEKHKFLAFILALLLTALLLWLIWYLMSEGRPLEGLGKVNDWFKDITRRAKVGKGPGKKPEGVGVGKEEEKKGWLGKYWWVVLLILLALAGGGIGGKKVWNRWRRGRPSGGGPPRVEGGPRTRGAGERAPARDPLENLLRRLNNLLKIKDNIQKFIIKLEKEKKKLEGGVDVTGDKIKKGGVDHFVSEILPRLSDRKSKQYQEFDEEYKSLKRLFEINLRLTTLYNRLLSIEDYIINNLSNIKGYIERLEISSDRLEKINILLGKLGDVSRKILSELRDYFKLESEEKLDEDKIKNLLSEENRQNLIRKEWEEEVKREKHLANVTKKEFDLFKKINRNIDEEKRILDRIIKILKGEEKKVEKGEKKGEGRPIVTGKIKLVKVPTFAKKESDMIGSAVSTAPKRWGISKQILDKTYQEIVARFGEIKNKGFSVEDIKIVDNRLPSDVYVPHRVLKNNPYSGRDMEWIVRYIGKIYGPLNAHWDNNVERIKERIRIVKQSAKEDSVFKRRYYENKDLFISPGDASRLYEDIEGEQRDPEMIEKMKTLDRAWQSWWNIFVLGVWQFNRLIRAINMAIQKQGT